MVERTLDGQADTLKERTIGIDVFGRLSVYDPSDDATVRVKAGEVRKHEVQQARFMVLKSPDIPSMLVETAYISNPQEEQRLRTPAAPGWR